VLRLATFYGPVWVIITFTLCLYLIIGYRILRDTAHVRKASCGEVSTNFSADGVTEIRLGGILVSKELSVEVDPKSPIHSVSPFSTVDQETFTDKQPQPATATTSIPRRDLSSEPNDTASKRGSRPSSKNSSAPEVLEGIDNNKSAAKIATTVTAANTPLGQDIDTMTSAPRIDTHSMKGAKTYAQVAVMLFGVLCIVWVSCTS
jgi:hypothetical protein